MNRSWISGGHRAQGVRRVGVAVALSTSVLGLGACSSDSAESAVAAQTTTDTVTPTGAERTTAAKNKSAAATVPADVAKAVTRHYMVFPDGVPAKGWKLVEAVRLTGEGRKAQKELDADLDWFAEFLGPGTSIADKPHLSLSGYSEGLAEFRKDHPVDKGVKVRSGKLLGHPAIWGADASIGSRFVVIGLTEDYSIELTAGGMKLADLRRLAATLEETNLAGWKKAGGVVVDCVPDEDCPGVDDS